MQKTINKSAAELEIKKQNQERKLSNEQYFSKNCLKHTPFFPRIALITSALTLNGAKFDIRQIKIKTTSVMSILEEVFGLAVFSRFAALLSKLRKKE